MLYTVKSVAQPAGNTGFLSFEGRVIDEGGLYSRECSVTGFQCTQFDVHRLHNICTVIFTRELILRLNMAIFCKSLIC